LVSYQLETLSRCFPSSIRQILDELPTTLETYKRTLSEIPEEKKKQTCASPVVVPRESSRPLRIEGLEEVLSIQFDSGTMRDLITGGFFFTRCVQLVPGVRH